MNAKEWLEKNRECLGSTRARFWDPEYTRGQGREFEVAIDRATLLLDPKAMSGFKTDDISKVFLEVLEIALNARVQ